MKDICPACEKVTGLTVICQEESITIRNESIPVLVEFLKCTECNTEFEDPKSHDDPVGRAYAIYRLRHNQSSPVSAVTIADAILALIKKHKIYVSSTNHGSRVHTEITMSKNDLPSSMQKNDDPENHAGRQPI